MRREGQADRNVALDRVGRDNPGVGIDAIFADLFVRRQASSAVFALALKGEEDKSVGYGKNQQKDDADDQWFFRFRGFVHGMCALEFQLRIVECWSPALSLTRFLCGAVALNSCQRQRRCLIGSLGASPREFAPPPIYGALKA